MVQCKTVPGVHYDTFGFVRIDQAKANKTFGEAALPCTCRRSAPLQTCDFQE